MADLKDYLLNADRPCRFYKPARSDTGILSRLKRVTANIVKLSASCLKNWSAIASAIACTTAKAVLLQLYA